MKEKKKENSFDRVRYINKPNEEKYSKLIEKTSEPKVKEYIEKIKKSQEDKYYKQQAKIATGQIPSKSKYYTKKTTKVIGEEIKKLSKVKVKSKPVLKKNSMVVNIPNYKAPSVLGDENRFFTGELNKEKRSLFFS